MSENSNKSLLDWDSDDQAVDAEFEQDFKDAAEVPKACSIEDSQCESCQ